jgi:hypothetical protein
MNFLDKKSFESKLIKISKDFISDNYITYRTYISKDIKTIIIIEEDLSYEDTTFVFERFYEDYKIYTYPSYKIIYVLTAENHFYWTRYDVYFPSSKKNKNLNLLIKELNI